MLSPKMCSVSTFLGRAQGSSALPEAKPVLHLGLHLLCIPTAERIYMTRVPQWIDKLDVCAQEWLVSPAKA